MQSGYQRQWANGPGKHSAHYDSRNIFMRFCLSHTSDEDMNKES